MLYLGVNYFFLRKSSAASGAMMLSTKVYAPDLGDLTILITLDNLLDDVCRVATVFFAMIQMGFEIIKCRTDPEFKSLII
jgi:hypothetical protein